MKLQLRTKEQRARDLRKHHSVWAPCFLFWPRRISPTHVVVGRAFRRLEDIKYDGSPVWAYRDFRDHVTAKLTGD